MCVIANDVSCASAWPKVDYAPWPASELKRVLFEASLATRGIAVEAGLLEAAAAADNARPRVAVAVSAGFVMDPASGYFHDVDSGWYLHGESGCCCANCKWDSKDGSRGAMVKLQAPAD